MNEITHDFPDSRPLVRAREYRWAPWLFSGVAAFGAIVLFTSLEAARSGRQQSDAQSATDQLAPIQPLAELTIPANPYPAPADGRTFASRPPAVQLVASRPVTTPARMITPAYTAPAPQPLVYEAPPSYPAPVQAAPVSNGGFPPDYEPIRAKAPSQGPSAHRLAAPSFTVIQGTMIPAVLETAMDSTRAGPVRALVSRDVRGFDGKNILIPRGSRLIGDYEADLAPGQARAVVNWTRLIRPDGASIDLKSPATDALGRVGVAGRVNNHTLRRLGDALLQTLVNAGSGFSQRAAPSVVVVPGGTQQAASVMMRDPSAIQPTLTVAQGARVSVFVAQDMDFSALDEPS